MPCLPYLPAHHSTTKDKEREPRAVRQLRAHPVPTLSKEKETMGTKKVVIHSDGVSRGNPGLAAIGATIKDEQGKLIARISRRIGTTTNNQAEYRAVIAALEEAINLGITHVELNSDSELIVRQIKGEYRFKKATLKPLHQKVKQLLGSLEGFTINHIPREQNTEADMFANRAL